MISIFVIFATQVNAGQTLQVCKVKFNKKTGGRGEKATLFPNFLPFL